MERLLARRHVTGERLGMSIYKVGANFKRSASGLKPENSLEIVQDRFDTACAVWGIVWNLYDNNFKSDMFSVILSLYANFDHIKSYLKQFTVILISETWINSEREIEFGIEGYEFMFESDKQAWWRCSHKL